MRKTIIIAGAAICIICAAVISYAVIERWGRDAIPSRDLTLSEYPKLFAKGAVIVIGENASQIEKQSAEAIAANLENLTGNKSEIVSSKKIERFKYTYNLIILGTPKSNEVLREVYGMTDAIRVTNEYPGENKGVLEILPNPWDEGKAMLLVEGSDEWKVENTENKQIDNANFSIKAKKYSTTLTITNTGNVVLTNIKIIKDRSFTKEGVIIHKEIIKVNPKLDVNESVNISIPEISSCGFLPERENITASNEGWIIITCDQGVTKKMAFCKVIPHTIKWGPTPLEFFVFYILPPVLVILLIIAVIHYISRIRRRKK